MIENIKKIAYNILKEKLIKIEPNTRFNIA